MRSGDEEQAWQVPGKKFKRPDADADGLEALRKRLYERYASTHAARDMAVGASDTVRNPYLERLIRRYFPSDRATNVLDLGCGDGALLQALRRHGYQTVRGVDTSPEQAARARDRGLDVVCGDILESLEGVPDLSTDVVVAFDVLEHFSKSDVLRLTDEVYRILRHGGRFVVHVPNGSALFGAPSFFSDLSHETCLTPRSMQQLMNVVGFSTTQIAEDEPTVHGVTSGTRWLLWQIIRRGAQFVHAVETGELRGNSVFSQNLLAVATK